MTLCNFVFTTFFTLWRSEVLVRQTNGKHFEEKRRCGQNTKSGGSDPTFSAFSRPSEPWGRSRPLAQWLLHVAGARADAQKPRHNNQSERDGEQHTKEAQVRGGSHSSLPRKGILSIFGECDETQS
jgi:hypothetical protein